MEPTATLAPEPAVGLPAEPGSQVPEQSTQVEPQGQPAGGSQVEEPGQSQSSQAGTRIQPSQFYADRRALRNLQNSYQTLLQQQNQMLEHLQKLSVPVAQNPQKPSSFDWSNPDEYINRRLEERLAELRGEIPQVLAERQSELENQRARQEALNLINTNESVKNDPNGLDKMRDILLDPKYGLEEMSKIYPLQAAHLALELYSQKNGGTSRQVQGQPTRGQMISTATGTQTGQSKKGSLEEEGKALMAQLQSDPELARDPQFLEKMKLLKQRRISEESRFVSKG